MAQHETVMGAALKRAGFDTGSRLGAVVLRVWKDEAGDRARFGRALWARLHADTELQAAAMQAFADVAVSEMSDGGHATASRSGQGLSAPVRQQNGDGAGQREDAGEGQQDIVRPSPTSREAGATYRASKDRAPLAPAREPSDARRKGIVAAHKAAAVAVNRRIDWLGRLYTDKGRPIVDLTVDEIEVAVKRLRHASGLHISRLVSTGHVAIVLRKIKERVDAQGVAPPGSRWVDILTQDDIDQIEREWTKENVTKETVKHLSSMNEQAIEMLLEQNNAA